MIWLVALILVLLPVLVWVLLAQEEALAARRRPPMGWVRRLWKRAAPHRRHCQRYRATIPLTYRVLQGEAAPTPTETRDISLGGLGIMLYEKLAAGTVVELNLQPAPSGNPMTVQGRIQWVREVPQKAGDPRRLFWAGIQITHTGTASLDQLRDLLTQVSPDGRQNLV